MNGIENIYTFRTAEKGVVHIQPRTDRGGYLELQALEGATIYLFRGARSVADCEAALAGEIPAFDVAAAIGQSARIKMEPGIGEITVFSKKESLGFIRTVEYAGCNCQHT